MSDNKNEYNVRFIGGLTLMIIMFAGDPDLCDAIIHWLMNN